MSTAPATPLNPDAAKKATLALYLIVFFSGACLMGMEIAGAKILAPGFGTSTFVWGSIIGLFMGALAAGYYIGGNLADKRPSFAFLATIVSVSGVMTALIPRFGPAVSDYVARMDMGPVWGPLFAATIIFFLPSFLMGMVSPYAVKLNASSLREVGGVAGRLYALSTFGSIVGTLITTFLLIPKMYVSNVLQMLGVVLIVTAIFSLWRFRSAVGSFTRDDRTGMGVMILFALLAAEGWVVLPVTHPMTPDARLLHYEDSAYHEILVAETVLQRRHDTNDFVLLPVRMWNEDDKEKLWWIHEVKRWLRFNENTESGIYPYKSEYKNAVTYTDLLHLPIIWQNDPLPKKILVVGGGGGIIPVQYSKWYNSECHIAEIDQAVKENAINYFNVPDDEKYPDLAAKEKRGKIYFHIEDGRQTVRKMKDGDFDVIVLDAYSSGGQIPFHLMTWEFMAEVKKKLSPRGVLITNIISALKNKNEHDIPPADLFLSNYKTLKSSQADVTGRSGDDKTPLFKQVYVFPKVSDGRPLTGNSFEDYRNVILVATNEDAEMPRDTMEEMARKLTRGDNPLVKAKDYFWNVRQKYDPRDEEVKAAQLLSDDFAPVDLMYRPVRRDETSRRLYWY